MATEAKRRYEIMSEKETRILSIHQEHEVLQMLENAGLDDQLAQKIIDSDRNELAKRLISFIRNGFSGWFDPATSHDAARAIMGNNFFGVEEAIKYLKVNPSRQALAYLAEIPFTEEVLRSVQKTHVLVAVFPISLYDLRDVCKKDGDPVSYWERWWLSPEGRHPWDQAALIGRAQCHIGWRLISKTPVEPPRERSWWSKPFTAKEEEIFRAVPDMATVLYSIVAHYKATGERLFESCFVKCLSRPFGDTPFIGYFSKEGFTFSYGNWGEESKNWGLASELKP
jgi:hypothetical protein